jgi:hypothetical protein
VDFLESHVKKIVKGELDSLEALHMAGLDLLEDLSTPLTIAVPSLFCHQSASAQLLEFFVLLRTPKPFFHNREDVL